MRRAGLLQSEEMTLLCWSGKEKKCPRFLPSQAQAGREGLEAMEIHPEASWRGCKFCASPSRKPI